MNLMQVSERHSLIFVAVHHEVWAYSFDRDWNIAKSTVIDLNNEQVSPKQSHPTFSAELDKLN